MRTVAHLWAGVVAAAAVTAACTSAHDGAADGARPPATIAWEDCGRRLDCGTLEVPVDPDDASLGTIGLSLVRHRAVADVRIGVLVVNPGGPGVPGTDLARSATSVWTDDVTDHFDVIGFDPRGTGASAGVVCVDDLDPYYALDPTPETPAERQALIDGARAFAAACEARNGALLARIATVDAAEDVERIRTALGEDTISWYGFSYGSELGTVYATLYPERVRAMVFDGAIDPDADAFATARAQAAGIEAGLDAFLADCSADRSCAFHSGGEAAAAFDRLFASFDTDPVPTEGSRPAVTQGVAAIAVVQALYDQAYWGVLAGALADAAGGDGRGLLALYDSYLDRTPDGSWAHTIDAFTAISCLDDPAPTDLGAYDRLADDLRALAPRTGEWLAYGYACAVWPYPARPTPTPDASGLRTPVLVVAAGGDPITPLASSRELAAKLGRAVLVEVDGESHTSYPGNECVQDVADAYLVELTVPEPGTRC